MTRLHLLLRSLRHYWRWHLGLALGVALTAAVLCGSLGVGDSLKATLSRQQEFRLGGVRTALVGGEKFVTSGLVKGGTGLVMMRGTAARDKVAQPVNVCGVDGAPLPAGFDFKGGLAINTTLARALGVKTGDRLVVRVPKPSAVSKEAPLSGESDETIRLPLEITRILSPEEGGDFTLKSEQAPPLNVFVPLALAQEKMGQQGRVNAALFTTPPPDLAKAWTLADAGLEVAWIDAAKIWSVTSREVFLDDKTAFAIQAAAPQAAPVLTYLVSGLRGAGDSDAPYSMVTAEASLGLTGDEVVINPWLADDQKLQPGSALKVSYFVMNRARQLEQKEASFTVKSVLPAADPRLEPSWTPKFPGVDGAASCADFKPGMKLKLGAIRKQDEAYWNASKGTPKAFISLEAGRRLWDNRFGKTTSFRIAAPHDAGFPAAFEAKLRERLSLTDLGVAVVDVVAQSRQAVDQAYDLGTLFISMSFFLIVTALGLAALLFLFTLESRASQVGVLMAVGLTGKSVRRLFVSEALLAAVPGALIGLAGGWFYTLGVLQALSGEWSGAVGGLEFRAAVSPVSLVSAFAGAVLLAWLTVWFTARRLTRLQPKDLLAGSASGQPSTTAAPGKKWTVIAVVSALGAAGAAAAGGNPLAFFAAGALVLTGGLAAGAVLLRRAATRPTSGLTSVWQLGWRNATRRPGRSLAVAGLLGAGVFMISAMAAFRLDAGAAAGQRSSGTGGFAFLGETSLPVFEDLNSPAGREVYDLEAKDLPGASLVQVRLHEGDEASCLNLARPQKPRVLGLPVAELASRSAFTFKSGITTWTALDQPQPDGALPAVLDASYATYTLKVGLGDTLPLGGSGPPARIVGLLDASILQGHVLLSEASFLRAFPDDSGFRLFLIDAPPDHAAGVSATLADRLLDRGLTLVPAVQKLNAFNAVQNTYLGIFSALGGLGLILSTLGLGVLLARNVLERRSEFAVLQAVGLPARALRRIVLGENALLLFTGFALGLAAALLAVWPVTGAPSLPWLTLAAIPAAGLAGCALAARLALRGNLVESLRAE